MDINDIVRDAVEMTRPKWKQECEAAGRGIEIRFDLRPCPRIAGNPFELTQAVGNLIFNALADSLMALNYGFVPGSLVPPCLAQCDADGNQVFNALSDGLYILNYNFVGGPPPPAPEWLPRRLHPRHHSQPPKRNH